jgi:putative transposase
LKYIQPGHPAQNAFIERFNRTYREEVLDAYLFESVTEVQDLSDEWLRIYNERRPHEALGSAPPIHFQPRAVLRRESTTPVST